MNMSRGIRFLITTSLAAAIIASAKISSQVATSQPPTSLQEADQTFQARCSTCHAEHGEGSEVGASLNVPDLRSQRIQGQDDDTLRRTRYVCRGNRAAAGGGLVRELEDR